MSRYTSTYFSESKGRTFMIEELVDAHLCRAARKLQKEGGKHDAALLRDLLAEVEARGLDLAYPNGRAPQEEGRIG